MPDSSPQNSETIWVFSDMLDDRLDVDIPFYLSLKYWTSRQKLEREAQRMPTAVQDGETENSIEVWEFEEILFNKFEAGIRERRSP